MNNIQCKNCLRWYVTGADQCEVPACGIDYCETDTKLLSDYKMRKATGKQKSAKISKKDDIGAIFIKSHLKYIFFANNTNKLIYASPSELNINNDCYFYKPLPTFLRWLTVVARYVYYNK